MSGRTIILSCVLLISMCITGYSGFDWNNSGLSTEHVDLIVLNSSDGSNTLQRSPVYFNHDRHSDPALHDGKLSCRKCHSDSTTFSTLSKDVTDSNDPYIRMNARHDECLGCHASMVNTTGKDGPVICSGCHIKTNDDSLSRPSSGFDKRLHYDHIETMEKRCDACHHVFNPETGKTEYKKGEEQSCVYCHGSKREPWVQDMKTISHKKCVGCHLIKTETEKPAGPILCNGCHSPEKRNDSNVDESIPVLPMHQPTTMVIKRDASVPSGSGPLYVGFQHQLHEVKTDSCIGCHHRALLACRECHTSNGTEKGDHINSQTAFHSEESSQSCLGCHRKYKQKRECSGCHSVISRPDDNRQCNRCHTLKSPDAVIGESLTDTRQAENHSTVHPDPKLSDIPESIVINTLENRYMPVTFPHRKVISSLSGGIAQSRLAAWFHNGSGSVCSGCHHNTTGMDRPPSCKTCHSITRKPSVDNKPSLYGAYHIQCMECHKKMDIRQPERCISCHEKKN